MKWTPTKRARIELILVTGDRKWEDMEFILKELKRFPNLKSVIQGGGRGADFLAHEVCRWHLEIPCLTVPARWKKKGKAAGPLRNQRMVNIVSLDNISEPLLLHTSAEGKAGIEDYKKRILVLAFHDNIKKSKGTKDMIARAKKAGLKVLLKRHK